MKYRKLPVEVDAIKFEYTRGGIKLLKSFCGVFLDNVSKARCPNAIGEAEIKTIEAGINHIAIEGDYIIKASNGEFYVCKPDIFELTYREVL
jgi:hypothetical protein